MKTNVVILGASHKPDRYSYRAVEFLQKKGYNPIPVHPRGNSVCGIDTRTSLAEVDEDIDTITLYVNSTISSKSADAIIEASPRRVIFNPGAENRPLLERLQSNGIECREACTLVLLRTGQF